jgi:hypothetical protein
MRWLHFDPNDVHEAQRQRAVIGLIDRWWDAFAKRADDLDALFSGAHEWDLPQWMNTYLQAINPGIMWEFGCAVCTTGHRLVLTPEAAKHLRPLVTTILERAPSLENWEFYPYRLRESVKEAQLIVEARVEGDLTGTVARVTRGQHNLVDLTYYSPTTKSNEDQQAFSNALVATETLLGEELLDKWVGVIEVAPLADADPESLVPLDRLGSEVDAAIAGIQGDLPASPHFDRVEDATWSGFELEPQPADDYPAQSDMFVGKSANKALWIAAHVNEAFYDERFTRCQETFCFVKMDGSQALDEERFADTAELEDALDEGLRAERLGCQIGGGTGLRYSYVDLALADLERGIAAVRDRLRADDVPRRSWIQFFNSDLAAEWIGVYDDSPPPPMPAWDG